MTFLEFYNLALRENIAFDLVIAGKEMLATVHPKPLTKNGRRIFANLLEADIELDVPPPVKYTKVCINIKSKRLFNDGNSFVNCLSKRLGIDSYNKIFGEQQMHPVREIAHKAFKTLLSLGEYRYAVQIDGHATDIIYAWTDSEAMEQAGFLPESVVIGG